MARVQADVISQTSFDLANGAVRVTIAHPADGTKGLNVTAPHEGGYRGALIEALPLLDGAEREGAEAVLGLLGRRTTYETEQELWAAIESCLRKLR